MTRQGDTNARWLLLHVLVAGAFAFTMVLLHMLVAGVFAMVYIGDI